MTDCSHRITRYEKIYLSKLSALEKLNNNLRPYGELVSIRYKENDEINVIVVFYVDNGYEILFDSSDNKNSRIFEVTRVNEESDFSCIQKAIFDEPNIKNRDLVVIHSDNQEDKLYIYINPHWISLSGGESTGGIRTINSQTLNLDLKRSEEDGGFVLKGNVPIDGESLKVNKNKIEVGYINCGSLKDLL